ncbi:hypothetical protein [Halolamina sp.]|uniref:hypothetical protein n=1 Tax=Halolamina sp. TaxID=1940283 RepID=UPI003565324A
MSFYTTLNFALWPDLSTPETIGTHSAIGIAGWLATFSSTALALYFQAADLTLLSHLNVVQALSLLLLFGLAVGLCQTDARTRSRERRSGGMSPTEAIPLLIVVLLMITADSGDVQEMSVTFQGENNIVDLGREGKDGTDVIKSFDPGQGYDHMFKVTADREKYA